jgi:hypothetical protein
MTPRNISIITDVAILAMQAAVMIAMHLIFISRAHDNARSLKPEEGYGGRKTATGRVGNRGGAARRAAEATQSA